MFLATVKSFRAEGHERLILKSSEVENNYFVEQT